MKICNINKPNIAELCMILFSATYKERVPSNGVVKKVKWLEFPDGRKAHYGTYKMGTAPLGTSAIKNHQDHIEAGDECGLTHSLFIRYDETHIIFVFAKREEMQKLRKNEKTVTWKKIYALSGTVVETLTLS